MTFVYELDPYDLELYRMQLSIVGYNTVNALSYWVIMIIIIVIIVIDHPQSGMIYTLNHKKRDILFLTRTLANLSRFL